jgi:hypothetical protein
MDLKTLAQSFIALSRVQNATIFVVSPEFIKLVS